MVEGKETALKPSNPLFSILLAICALGGCASDDDPAGTGPPADTDRETPSNLVARWLPHVVAARDSAGLEAAVDDGFVYLSGTGGTKEELLDYIGRALAGHPDDGGRKLTEGDLVLFEKGTFLDPAAYEGKPEGETWYKSSVSVDLLLVFDGPEGRSTDRFDEEMFLVVRPDPDAPHLWVVVRAEIADPIP